MVWDRRPERDADARDRCAGAAHSCDAGRSRNSAQPGREWFGALERKSGAVRRSHAPRLRTPPRYRQSGEAQARVTDDGWFFAEGCRAAAQTGVKAEAAAGGMQHKEKHHHRNKQVGSRPFGPAEARELAAPPAIDRPTQSVSTILSLPRIGRQVHLGRPEF